jgi:hypothetical protein
VPTFDLALSLRMEWSATNVFHFFAFPSIEPDLLRCSLNRYR